MADADSTKLCEPTEQARDAACIWAAEAVWEISPALTHRRDAVARLQLEPNPVGACGLGVAQLDVHADVEQL